MPRKQRFKPSRKPKPIEPAVPVETARPDQVSREVDPNNPNTEPRPYDGNQRADDIESGGAARVPATNPAVIEDTSH
jgi:hypothetical protein